MGVFISALLGALIQAAGTLVGRVLLSLGISYVTFQGVDTTITYARDFLVSSILSTDSRTVAVAGALHIGRVISILTSALIGRMVVGGLTGGAVKKMLVK